MASVKRKAARIIDIDLLTFDKIMVIISHFNYLNLCLDRVGLKRTSEVFPRHPDFDRYSLGKHRSKLVLLGTEPETFSTGLHC